VRANRVDPPSKVRGDVDEVVMMIAHAGDRGEIDPGPVKASATPSAPSEKESRSEQF
jgi:hypothetical protein